MKNIIRATERVQALADISSASAYIRVYCHSNETCAPIANPPKSAQLQCTAYHLSKLHPGPCSSVGMRPGTVRQTHTHRQTHRRPWPIYISLRLRLTQNI